MSQLSTPITKEEIARENRKSILVKKKKTKLRKNTFKLIKYKWTDIFTKRHRS